MNPRKKLRAIYLSAIISALPFSAIAGEQYIDKTGFAISGYDTVAYFDLNQNNVGTAQPTGIPGKSDITAEYNGVNWAFSTTGNRDRFLADPTKYAPLYDGHCAYGMSLGGKVPANPNLWRIVDNQLYLNITKTVVGLWEKDVPGNIVKAEANWPTRESKPASTNKIPEFSSTAPEQ